MKKLLFVVSMTIMVLLIVGCAGETPASPSQAASDFKLTPYHTATLTPTVTATPEGLPTQTPQPTVTPTPRTYEIQEGDLLGVIAYYYGITVDDLLAANPDLNPSLMVVGSTLVIPPARDVTSTAAAPTPTPFAVTLNDINCLDSSSGGLHCFVLTINDRKNPATNLTGEFQLIDSAGAIVATRSVSLPLAILEAGARLPFYTYFSPAEAAGHTVAFTLLTATRADAADTTNLILPVEVNESLVNSSGSSATVSGTITPGNSETSYTSLTIVAVAYDAAGNVIGLRRVETQTELTPGAPQPFTIEVFSVSGSISTVEVYAEAGN